MRGRKSSFPVSMARGRTRQCQDHPTAALDGEQFRLTLWDSSGKYQAQVWEPYSRTDDFGPWIEVIDAISDKILIFNSIRYGCPTRTRTLTDGTRIRRATITPSGNFVGVGEGEILSRHFRLRPIDVQPHSFNRLRKDGLFIIFIQRVMCFYWCFEIRTKSDDTGMSLRRLKPTSANSCVPARNPLGCAGDCAPAPIGGLRLALHHFSIF